MPSADNILRVLGLASPVEVEEGLAWYQTAHTFAVGLSRRYLVSIRSAANVIALSSVQVTWERNQMIADTYLRTRSAEGLGFRSLQGRLALAASGASLDRICSTDAPKIKAFAECIARPSTSESVTIDRHAIDVADGVRHTVAARPKVGRAGPYSVYEDAYREAATHTPYTAVELQAVTWVVQRRLFQWKRG